MSVGYGTKAGVFPTATHGNLRVKTVQNQQNETKNFGALVALFTKNPYTFCLVMCYNTNKGKRKELALKRSQYEEYFVFYDTESDVSVCI